MGQRRSRCRRGLHGAGLQVQARRVEITADVPRYLGLLADREMFRSAIWNLVVNAVEAMPARRTPGGHLVHRRSWSGAGSGRQRPGSQR